MSEAVEIYICKKGQALKDGKVEYSQSIHDKHGAEQNAQARVKRNASIHRIAYYKVNAEGDFRIFYSFTNPALDAPTKTDEDTKKKPKKKKRVKKTFWQTLFGLSANNPKDKKPKKP